MIIGKYKYIFENPRKCYEEMLANDEKFRKFVEENEGKSAQQIAKEYGIEELIPLFNTLEPRKEGAK